jgi:hypothetical protein
MDDAWAAISFGDRAGIAAALGRLGTAVTAHERAQKEELLPVLCETMGSGELKQAIRELVDL